MKIVVFGGSGFLGSHVCDKLTDAGYEVTIYDIKKSPWIKKNQKMIIGDILDAQKVRDTVSNADFVFNFAGIADIDDARTRPVETVQYNILGNTIILDACATENVDRIIYASTVYVYSESGGFYKCSKQASELYIENFYKQYKLKYTILRYGSLYGPRTDIRNGIHNFVYQALKNKKIVYYGSPNAVRQYIHVVDAARLSVEILKPDYTNRHITLSGSETLKISQLFKMIEEISGQKIEIEYNSSGEHPHYDLTPYSYSPKVGMKLSSPYYVDLGEGILRVVENIHQILESE
jgi:UDP-glucose 4-epimerase